MQAFLEMYRAALESQAATWAYSAAAYLAHYGDAAAEVAVARYWTLIAAGVNANYLTDIFYQCLDALS